jgi:DNA-binding NarL/FixJ family response regulator
MGGLEACPLLRTPTTAVVMLSIDDDETMRARCAEAGASAFVSKHSPAATLLAAIRSAATSR